MKVQVQWFLTGKISTFEEADDILNQNTTIAELKGLIQIRFGFNVCEIVIIKEHLIENDSSLGSIGIVGGPNDPVLTAHVVRESELEPSNVDNGEIHEFCHSDFILAMKMLGKPVPVSDDRLIAMRVNAPRQRPAFLNTPSPAVTRSSMEQSPHQFPRIPQEPTPTTESQEPPPTTESQEPPPAPKRHSSIPPPPLPEDHVNRRPPKANMPGIPAAGLSAIPTYNPRTTAVFQIFENVLYGLRKEGVDEEYRLNYPGMDPLPFWDMRVPDPAYRYERECQVNEICLELFYFGEFKAVKDKTKLIALVHQTIDSKAGVRVRTPLPLREAGCMYPLIAVPVVINEVDAMILGDCFFEHFGQKQETTMVAKGTRDAAAEGVSTGVRCPTQ